MRLAKKGKNIKLCAILEIGRPDSMLFASDVHQIMLIFMINGRNEAIASYYTRYDTKRVFSVVVFT